MSDEPKTQETENSPEEISAQETGNYNFKFYYNYFKGL